MATNLNASERTMALGQEQSQSLEALYSSYFKPNATAVQAATATSHFQIFSAIDYSVPVYYSDSTQRKDIK